MPLPALSTSGLHAPDWLLIAQNWLKARAGSANLNTTRWTLAGVIAITGVALSLLGARAIETLRSPQASAAAESTVDVPRVLARLQEEPLFESTTPQPGATRKISYQPSPWQLQGLFSGDNHTEGSAILSHGGQPAVVARSGTLLSDGTRLLEVHRDQVILQRPDGSRRILPLRPPGAALQGANQTASKLALKPATGMTARSLSEGNSDELAQRRAKIRQRLETLRQRARDSSANRS